MRSARPDVVGVRLAAALNAVVRSLCACAATASATCAVPVKVPFGGALKPVIEVPGLTPMSPLITDGPVFVTVLAPRTPKVAAAPRSIGPSSVVAAWLGPAARSTELMAAARPVVPNKPRLIEKLLIVTRASTPSRRGKWIYKNATAQNAPLANPATVIIVVR